MRTKAEVLSILTSHRDRLKSETERPGWNQWALYGALFSVIWMGLDLYQSDEFNYRDSVIILLCVIILERLSSLSPILERSVYRTEKRYKFINEDIQASLTSSLYLFIVNGAFIFFFYTIEVTDKPYASIPFYYVCIAASIHGSVLLSRNLPLIISDSWDSNKILRRGANIIVVITLSLYIATLISAILLVNDFMNINMLKSACILIAAYFILAKIIEELQANPLIDSLDDLIYDVTFDEIKPEEAIEDFKIILIGSGFNEIIADMMQDHFALKRSFDSKKIEFSAKIAECNESSQIEREKKKKKIGNDYKQLKKQLKKLGKVERSIRNIMFNFLPLEYESEEFANLVRFISNCGTVRSRSLQEIESKYQSLR